MCACLKALCTEEQIRELSKLLDLGEQSFDSFSLDYYSPLPWPGESLSPRENMEFILSSCRSYAENFDAYPHKNLFFNGPPGLGKTLLQLCPEVRPVLLPQPVSHRRARAGQDLPLGLHRPHRVGERLLRGVRHGGEHLHPLRGAEVRPGQAGGRGGQRRDPPLPGLRPADSGRSGQRAFHPLRPVRPLHPHQHPPDGGQADGDLLQPDHGSGARPLYPPDRLPPGGRVPRAPLLWGGYPAVEKTDAIKSGRGVSTLLCLIFASEATYFVLKDLAKIMAPVIPSTSAIARYICNRSNSSGT